MENRLVAAEASLRPLLADKSLANPAAQLLGEVLRRRGRRREAEIVLRDCLERVPDFFLARQSYALTLHGDRKFTDALVETDRLLARDPSDNRSRLMKAAALTETGDFAAAIKVTKAVLRDFPDQPRAWLVHGNGLRTLGRIEESIAAFRACIELDPGCAEAFWGLANLKTYRFTADDVAAMKPNWRAANWLRRIGRACISLSARPRGRHGLQRRVRSLRAGQPGRARPPSV